MADTPKTPQASTERPAAENDRETVVAQIRQDLMKLKADLPQRTAA